MRRNFLELIPPLVTCVALPTYLGAVGTSLWLFIAYLAVASFALAAREGLTRTFDDQDGRAILVKLAFWVASSSFFGMLAYLFGRLAVLPLRMSAL